MCQQSLGLRIWTLPVMVRLEGQCFREASASREDISFRRHASLPDLEPQLEKNSSIYITNIVLDIRQEWVCFRSKAKGKWRAEFWLHKAFFRVNPHNYSGCQGTQTDHENSFFPIPVNVSVHGLTPARRLEVPKSEIFTTPLYVFTKTLSP